MEMLRSLGALPAAIRPQVGLLAAVRALSGCAKSIAELASAYLLLELLGWDYARSARVSAVLGTVRSNCNAATRAKQQQLPPPPPPPSPPSHPCLLLLNGTAAGARPSCQS